jgi:limonene-1,2-epoxide hydrolase
MNTIRIESSSITGQENQENLSPPLQALSEFYSAFNNQDLERMARNWLQSDEAIMDNPLGVG